jgi:hypothetical protein
MLSCPFSTASGDFRPRPLKFAGRQFAHLGFKEGSTPGETPVTLDEPDVLDVSGVLEGVVEKVGMEQPAGKRGMYMYTESTC